MILKSYIIEQDINILEKYISTIFYGENDGIKDDIKKEIKSKNKNAEIINLFQEEIIKNKNILIDQINNSSLFSSKKIIFLHEASDKIFEQLIKSLEENIQDIKIYIFANILEKRSKVRTYFEKENNLGIVACYQDNERTLSNYISLKLKGYNGLSPQIINLIINNCNLDRKLISAEITKIKDLFQEKKIDEDKLKDLLNIKFNKGFNQIRDASLLGDKTKVNSLINEIEFLNEDTFFYLNQMNSRISKLIEVKNLDESFRNEEEAIDNIKPKIFWKDKPIFINQLKKWKKNQLEFILNKVGKTELLLKKNSQIRNDVVIKSLLINICNQASNSF